MYDFYIAYNYGSDYDIKFKRVRAEDKLGALIEAFKDDYPAIQEAKAFEDAKDILFNQDIALGILEGSGVDFD